MPEQNHFASVQARLRNLARDRNVSVTEMDQHYVMERLLYRLSNSRFRNEFVLKGAVMLRSLELPAARPTRDVDLLGLGNNDEQAILAVFGEVFAKEYPQDGVRVDLETLRIERIVEGADYSGLRLFFRAYIGTSRYEQRIDIGFGDRVHPAPLERTLPTILNHPAPILLCYSLESVIAEKLQAMLHLGDTNTRLKDYYDIWWLSNHSDFSGSELAESVRLTLGQRGTRPDTDSSAFSEDFNQLRKRQWKIFRERLSAPDTPEDLEVIVDRIREFTGPLLEALSAGREFSGNWKPPGPWR